MAHRIEVAMKPGLPDPAGADVKARLAEDLGIAVDSVQTIDVYTINAEVSDDELEKVRFDEQGHINQAAGAANDEIIQLKAMINALRHDLEVQRLDNEAHARQVLSAANSEINQLRATVVALREQLEQHDAG